VPGSVSLYAILLIVIGDISSYRALAAAPQTT
jgi:hypothetical protein